MKYLRLLLPVFAIVLSPLYAQWVQETYSLKGGWNAIYVHGDASYITLDDLLTGPAGSQVEEVWRWNKNSTAVQFTESPQTQSQGTPEWSVWRRSDPQSSTLLHLSPRAGYLIKCAGTSSNSYTLTVP